MAERKIKRALIAVYDKSGIVEFARALVDEFGIEIISTGGTAKHLKDAGIPVTLVEQVTGFPEMLDGRVKTLHPKIHAAILADRDNPEHMRQLAEQGIEPIDMVVVNLYPFEKTIADPNCTFKQAIEMIDIGGPCLLRAAAKNHRHVLVVTGDSAFFQITLEHLRMWQERVHRDDALISGAFGAFWNTAGYDATVAEWLSGKDRGGSPSVRSARFLNWGALRYGENPHQVGELLRWWQPLAGFDLTDAEAGVGGQENWQERISFNNYVDADAAIGLCSELTRATGPLWHRLLAGANSGLGKAQLQPISNQLKTRRNLPHIQRPGATYFVTFRIRSRELSESEREIVFNCLIYTDGRKVCLHAGVVMPDHAHMLMTPLEDEHGGFPQLGEILQGVKGVSARRINESRKQSGAVWLDENWDRVIRHEKEFRETYQYIQGNPDAAGIEPPGGYPWSVVETESGWNGYDSCGGVDLGHELVSGSGRVLKTGGSHRLIAGATSVAAGAANAGRRLPTCLFIKHTNACGVGVAEEAGEAYRRAYLGDANAAMGGILAVNFDVDAEFAAMVMQTYDRLGKPFKEAGAAQAPGGFFIEVWVAPSFSEEAVDIIRGKAAGRPQKKWGENVRLLYVGDMGAAPDPNELEYKTIAGGMLVQTPDLVGLNEDQWRVVTKREPTPPEISDLSLAWLIAKHTKSNAISICKDGMLIGNGAGQMSRVMSCRIATWLAKENGHADKLVGSAAASDAFFPFRDGPDILIDAGVTAIIQPGGSKRDEETIRACDERGVAMIFTGTRHFRH